MIVTMTCIPKGISLVYFKEIEVFMTSYPIEMPASMLFIKQSSLLTLRKWYNRLRKSLTIIPYL